MTSLHGNLFSCPVTVSYWSDVVIYCTLDVWLFIQTVRNQQPANILGFTLVWVIMFELYVSKQKLKPTFGKWTGRLFSVLNEHALEDLSRLSSKSWKFFFFYVNQERKTLQEIKLNSLVCWQNIKYTQKSHDESLSHNWTKLWKSWISLGSVFNLCTIDACHPGNQKIELCIKNTKVYFKPAKNFFVP